MERSADEIEPAHAWKRVKARAGVEGLDIARTVQHLRHGTAADTRTTATGNVSAQPVRRVSIPKPEGGESEPGIPTVTDRLIQQALLQVLQPILDPMFSEHSYGFRPWTVCA